MADSPVSAAGAMLRKDRAELSCRHCGLPSPAGDAYCCAGCEAIAMALAGMPALAQPAHEMPADLAHYDDPIVRGRFERDAGNGQVEALFVLEGLRCGACAWLAERAVEAVDGVVRAEASFATSRLLVRWDPVRARPGTILAAARARGYEAWPCDERRLARSESTERRAALRRLLLSAFAMMQVMMYAAPAYLAGPGEITEGIASLLRWTSLLLAVPVIAYCAAPIFAGAWRDARRARLGMDAPVAIGLAAAFAASAWSTVVGHGDVYFDSIAMFVFLLTGARYLEMTARHQAGRSLARLGRLAREVAHRIEDAAGLRILDVPASSVRAGDRLLVRDGEIVPADGILESDAASLDESLLTGESRPIVRERGAPIAGGAVASGTTFTLRVTRVGPEATLGALERLMERALAARPPSLDLAQRAAMIATVAIVACAAVAGAAWWFVDPSRALAVAIAVLIVTCPCALSLAAPAALGVATGRLARGRFVVTRGHAIETLAAATDVVFDKTGTLTLSAPRLLEVIPLASAGAERCLVLAAALARGSGHPLDAAIREAAKDLAPIAAAAHRVVAGSGVAAVVDGAQLRLGGAEFVRRLHGAAVPLAWLHEGATVAWLGDASGWIAALRFGEELRPGAHAAVAELLAQGRRVHLLTGDAAAVALPLGRALGIERVEAGAKPEDKQRYVRELQSRGACVAMVGDGVNDAPVLAQSNVSIAMAGGADLAQLHADAVLLSGSLADLADAFSVARRARRVVRQNLAWALAYHLAAVPLAMAGWVTPLAAGVGMAASSIAVVANALRLRR